MSFRNNQIPLHNKQSSKSFVSPISRPPKLSKPTITSTATNQNDNVPPPPPLPSQTLNSIDKMTSILADSGCTLINAIGPPCLSAYLYKLRHHLQTRLSTDFDLRSQFLEGFSTYIDNQNDLCRVLLPSQRDNISNGRNDSLVRVLLLIPCIQLSLQMMLLEKLPEYFNNDSYGNHTSSSLRLDEDIARLIIKKFRWLDFLVDSEAFMESVSSDVNLSS